MDETKQFHTVKKKNKNKTNKPVRDKNKTSPPHHYGVVERGGTNTLLLVPQLLLMIEGGRTKNINLFNFINKNRVKKELNLKNLDFAGLLQNHL